MFEKCIVSPPSDTREGRRHTLKICGTALIPNQAIRVRAAVVRLPRRIPSTGHDRTQQLRLFKIQKYAPLGGSPVQLKSVLMMSSMTSSVDVMYDVIET